MFCSFISLILYVKSKNKEDSADISRNIEFSYGIQWNKYTYKKTTDSQTIGWKLHKYDNLINFECRFKASYTFKL